MLKLPLCDIPLSCLALRKAGFSSFILRAHFFWEADDRRGVCWEWEKESTWESGLCLESRGQGQCRHRDLLRATVLRTAYMLPHCFHQCYRKFMNLKLKAICLSLLCHLAILPWLLRSGLWASLPKLDSVTSNWWLSISCIGSIYTTEMIKCYKRASCWHVECTTGCFSYHLTEMALLEAQMTLYLLNPMDTVWALFFLNSPECWQLIISSFLNLLSS